MRLLLDTHVFLWWLANDSALTDEHRKLIGDRRNSCYVSAATVWEITIKQGLGKLDVASEYLEVARSQGFIELAVSWVHAEGIRTLPDHHRDPFDRILISQAIAEEMVLLSVDPLVKQYDLKVL